MDLVCSVMANLCLANDDVSLRRGVTKIRMPRSAVKHYWLGSSIDICLRASTDTKVHFHSGGNKDRSVLPGTLRDNHCQKDTLDWPFAAFTVPMRLICNARSDKVVMQCMKISEIAYRVFQVVL